MENQKFKDFLAKKGIENFAETDVEKQAELFNEYNDQVRKSLNEAIEGKASKEDITRMREELQHNMAEQMKSLNETLKAYGVQIRELSNKNEAPKPANKGLREQLEGDLKDRFEDWKQNRTKSFNVSMPGFTQKAPGTMTLSGSVTGEVPAAQYIPGLDRTNIRQLSLLNMVSRRTATSNLIRWVSQANEDGAAGTTAEGAAKNQVDFDLVTGENSVRKVTAYIKVSDEMLDDIDFMESEINTYLLTRLVREAEEQIYSGDGLGSNLEGIREVATAFAAGTFAAGVDNANIVDVLRVAINQIQIANQPMPTAIFMHPTDLTALKLQKVTSTDQRYIQALQEIAMSQTLDGIPIITTTLVTQDDYLVGAFNLALLYEKGGIQIEFGYENDDFTKNLRTIRAEWRGAMIVRTNDRPAFVKGDFTTDKAALETV